MATIGTYDPQASNQQPVNIEGYNPADANATTWNADGGQLVQNQVSGIIAKDSPLMQQAAGAAKQQMAAKGLLNSSMAINAGQNAVIAQALPMAQQDAATQANAAQFNAQAKTNVDLANANAANTAQQFNATQKNQFAATGMEYQLDTAQKTSLANLSTAAAERLANIEAAYKNLNQMSSSAASVMNTTMSAIARIMEDNSLDAAAKQTAIDIYNANAETSLRLIASLGGDVDLDQFFAQLGV